MRTLFTLLILTFLCTCGRAQVANYKPGKIVLSDGSERTGWVNAQANNQMANAILFRAAKNDRDSEKRYLPQQLQRVEFTESEKVYKSIPYTFTPVGDTTERNEFRMAELLYDGYYDLYTLDRATGEFLSKGDRVDNRTYFLVDGDEATLLAIIQRPVKLRLSDGESNVTFNLVEDYRGKLKYYFRDWDKANNRIEKMRYNTTEMLQLFEDYTLFKDPKAAKTDIGGRRFPIRVAGRLNFSPEARIFGGVEGADNAAFGFGIYFSKPTEGSNGTITLESGLEVYLLSFNLGPQRNASLQYEGGVGFRIPVYGNLYLNKNNTFQPRVRLGGSGSLLALYGDEVAFLGSRQAFLRGRLEVSMYAGLGADIGNFIVDAGYDLQMGLLVSAGVRF